MKSIKILIAEDELPNVILLKKILGRSGFEITSVNNGADALRLLERDQFDVLLTDWMMPRMDGIELIRRVRENVRPVPLIIIITALVSDGARSHALESGADDYVSKPIDVEELISTLKEGLVRRDRIQTASVSEPAREDEAVIPPFAGVAIATSTGGPPALIETFRNIPGTVNAAFYVVQHGPAWMLDTFCQRLQKETRLKIILPFQDYTSEAGCVYVAPGDSHLLVEKKTFRVILDDGPKENYVRPAADPLFRSLADAYGVYSIGLVLTGLGRDGVKGASYISGAGGSIIVQDPATAVASSMPKSVIDAGIGHTRAALTDVSRILMEKIDRLNTKLSELKHNE